MAISRLSDSSIQDGFPKYTSLWDGRSTIGSMDPLGGITLTAAQSTITFSNIPQTYTHLQLRYVAQTNRGTYSVDAIKFQLNSDTGSNYDWHYISSAGASPATTGVSSATTTTTNWANAAAGTTTGGHFASGVLDIFDYTNTNKYKTGRYFTGLDTNGFISSYAGTLSLNSGLWRSTAAINRIDISIVTGTLFSAYSSFALYGIK